MEACMSGLDSLTSPAKVRCVSGSDCYGDRPADCAAPTTQVGHTRHRFYGAATLSPISATSCLDQPKRCGKCTTRTASSSIPLRCVDTTTISSTDAMLRVRRPAGNDNLHEQRDVGIPLSPPQPPTPLSVPQAAAAPPSTSPPPPESVNTGRNVGNVSRAAAEAWTAAEAWAFTIASATTTAATTGATVGTVAEGGAGGHTKTTAKAAALELAKPREFFVISGGDQDNSRCNCEGVNCRLVNRPLLTPTAVSPTTAGCAGNPAATVHNHDTTHFFATKGSPDSRVQTVVNVRSKPSPTRPPPPPPPLRAHKNPQANRRKRSSFESVGYSRSVMEAGFVGQFVPLRGAAAVVLQRIEHGEKVWRRHVQWTGMAMLRAHCLWVRELRSMEIVASNHHKCVCLKRGFKGLKARVEWIRRRRRAVSTIAAAAAAVADTFYRARRGRRGVMILRRNRQACAALRSRDDLAELQFAECRVPEAVRSWAGRARAMRSNRLSHDAAASTWRSRTLQVALAQWVVAYLGDGESRRRRQAWRHALLQAPLYADEDEVKRGEDGHRLDEIHTSGRSDNCGNTRSILCDENVRKVVDESISSLETQSPSPPLPPPPVHETTIGMTRGVISTASAEVLDLGLQGGATADGRDEEGKNECGTSEVGMDYCEITKTVDLVMRPSAVPCKGVRREYGETAGAIVRYRQVDGANQQSVLDWVGPRAADGQGEQNSTKAAGCCGVKEMAPDYNADRCIKPGGVFPVAGRRQRRYGDSDVDEARPPKPSMPGSETNGYDVVVEPTESRTEPALSSRVQDTALTAERSSMNSDIIVWRALENEGQMLPKGFPPGSPQARCSEEIPGVHPRPLAMYDCARGLQLLEYPATTAAVAETLPAADGVQEDAEGSRDLFISSEDPRYYGDEWMRKVRPKGRSTRNQTSEISEEDQEEGRKEGDEDSMAHERGNGNIKRYEKIHNVGLCPAKLTREVLSISTSVVGEDTLDAFIASEVKLSGGHMYRSENVIPVDGWSNLGQSPPNDASHNSTSSHVEDTELADVVSIVEQDQNARSPMERWRWPTALDHRSKNFALGESGSFETSGSREPQSQPAVLVRLEQRREAVAGIYPRENRLERLTEVNRGQFSLAPDVREEPNCNSAGVGPFSQATSIAEGERCIVERSHIPGSTATLCRGPRSSWEFVSGQMVDQVTNADSNVAQGRDVYVLPGEVREARVGVELLNGDGNQKEEKTPERVSPATSAASRVGNSPGRDSHPNFGINLGPNPRPVEKERATEGSGLKASGRCAQHLSGREGGGEVLQTLGAELAVASADFSDSLSRFRLPSAQTGTVDVVFGTKSDCGAGSMAPSPALDYSVRRSSGGPSSSVVSGCFLHTIDSVNNSTVDIPIVFPSAIATEAPVGVVTTTTAMPKRGGGRLRGTSREVITQRHSHCQPAGVRSSQPGSSDNDTLPPDLGLGNAGLGDSHAPPLTCDPKHPQKLSPTVDLENPSSLFDRDASVLLEEISSAECLKSPQIPENAVGLQWSQRAGNSTSGGGGGSSSPQSFEESGTGRRHEESIAIPEQPASFPPVLTPGIPQSASTSISYVTIAGSSDLQPCNAQRVPSNASELMQQRQPPTLPAVPAISPGLIADCGAQSEGIVARPRQPSPCGDASSAGERVGLGASHAPTASGVGGSTGQLCGKVGCAALSGRGRSTGGDCRDDDQGKGGRREFSSASSLSVEYSDGGYEPRPALLGEGHLSSRYHHVLTVAASASGQELEYSTDVGGTLLRSEGLFRSLPVRDLLKRSAQHPTNVGAGGSSKVLDVVTPSGGNPCVGGQILHATSTPAGPPGVTNEVMKLVDSSEMSSSDAFEIWESRAAKTGTKNLRWGRGSDRATGGDYVNAQRVACAGISSSNSRNIGARLEPLTITSPSALNTRSSRISSGSHRGRATMLLERVSEEFVRRRLCEMGIRQWRLRIVYNTVNRRFVHGVNATILTLAKRIALSKWRTAHAGHMARKTAAATRQSGRHATVARVNRSRASPPVPAPAVAMVALRRWRRHTAGMANLLRTFHAWEHQSRQTAALKSHFRQALARRGIARWRIVTREFRRTSKKKVVEVGLVLLRAKGRRRLRMWRERRRRRDDAYRKADSFRQFPVETSARDAYRTADNFTKFPVKTPARLPWICRCVRNSFLAWIVSGRGRAATCARRRGILAISRNNRRRRAILAWHRGVAARVLRKESKGTGETYCARHRATQGMRGLRSAVRRGFDSRGALEVGKRQWKQRGAAWMVRIVREALAVRRRILHRVYAVRLRGGARAGLRRWRKFARDVRGIEQASSTADAWLRKQLLLTGLTATMGGAARGSVRNRSMRAGQDHLARRVLSRTLASWRVWTLGRVAILELSVAAGDLHAARMASVGLRGLGHMARKRAALRRGGHGATLHLLRTAGLERWHAATVDARQGRAKRTAATVHWATTLLTKVLLSWETAAVRHWASARQEEIAADYDRRICQKRGLAAWATVVTRSCGTADPCSRR